MKYETEYKVHFKQKSTGQKLKMASLSVKRSIVDITNNKQMINKNKLYINSEANKLKRNVKKKQISSKIFKEHPPPKKEKMGNNISMAVKSITFETNYNLGH